MYDKNSDHWPMNAFSGHVRKIYVVPACSRTGRRLMILLKFILILFINSNKYFIISQIINFKNISNVQ